MLDTDVLTDLPQTLTDPGNMTSANFLHFFGVTVILESSDHLSSMPFLLLHDLLIEVDPITQEPLSVCDLDSEGSHLHRGKRANSIFRCMSQK